MPGKIAPVARAPDFPSPTLLPSIKPSKAPPAIPIFLALFEHGSSLAKVSRTWLVRLPFGCPGAVAQLATKTLLVSAMTLRVFKKFMTASLVYLLLLGLFEAPQYDTTWRYRLQRPILQRGAPQI